jgi:prepilin-type N-terminal cleavage/methylation domain-containing protein
MSPKKSHQSGFSLIEALMVVSIVALVAAVAVPSLIGAKDAAEKTAIIVNLRSMHNDQVAYHTTHSRYARLSELNEFSGSLYGNLYESTLRRQAWTFLMSPTPTDSSLKTRYEILTYRMRNGRIESAFTMDQSGSASTVIP